MLDYLRAQMFGGGRQINGGGFYVAMPEHARERVNIAPAFQK